MNYKTNELDDYDTLHRRCLLEQGFCVRRAEVQNLTAVFQLNFSNKTSFCASKSRPNAKPQNVIRKHRQTNTKRKFNKQKQ